MAVTTVFDTHTSSYKRGVKRRATLATTAKKIDEKFVTRELQRDFNADYESRP